MPILPAEAAAIMETAVIGSEKRMVMGGLRASEARRGEGQETRGREGGRVIRGAGCGLQLRVCLLVLERQRDGPGRRFSGVSVPSGEEAGGWRSLPRGRWECRR
jgi:hypothetical protein